MSDPIRWQAEHSQGTSKYRASCDSCNEAKVRCSQEKPTCARCQKSQRTCIYGLSRRSHRSANRPGASNHEQQEKQQQKQQQNIDQWQHPEQQQPMSTPSSNATNTQTNGTQSPIDIGDNIHVTPWMSLLAFPENTSLDSGIGANLFSGSPSLVNTVLQDQNGGLDLGLSASDFSDMGLEIPSGMDLTLSTPSGESALGNEGSGCRTSRFMLKLASTAVPLFGQGYPLDVQLSHLKTALTFAEESLRLSRTDCDDIVPLIISTLVCSIIKGFEKSLEALNEPGEADTESPNIATTQQPQFSWGALRIDDSTELALLKRHMWLVQFQRVGAVLQGMQDRTKGMKHEQMDQAIAQQILVSNHMHMWLEQRAHNVKQKFTMATGDPSSKTEPHSFPKVNQLMMPHQ
ncbi:hypothetical protein F4808DRAFT_471597 [Astrocystis sublimbata]|nr:hypothetical protein F4808DRAFT_471597 [Astrocystis sublimbata]